MYSFCGWLGSIVWLETKARTKVELIFIFMSYIHKILFFSFLIFSERRGVVSLYQRMRVREILSVMIGVYLKMACSASYRKSHKCEQRQASLYLSMRVNIINFIIFWFFCIWSLFINETRVALGYLYVFVFYCIDICCKSFILITVLVISNLGV